MGLTPLGLIWGNDKVSNEYSNVDGKLKTWISSKTAKNILRIWLDGSEENEKFLAATFKTTTEQLKLDIAAEEGDSTKVKTLIEKGALQHLHDGKLF